MKTRLRIGIPLLGGVLALLAVDSACDTDLGFTLLLAAFIAGGLYEFYEMMAPAWGRVPASVGIVAGLLLVALNWIEVHCPGGDDVPWTGVLLVLVLFALFAHQMGVSEPAHVPRLFVLVFGLIYIWLPLSFALRLRDFAPPALAGRAAPGAALCLLVLLVSKLTDAGAYFTGKSVGRVKLAPVVSPSKTVEGAIGGFVVGCLVGLGVWRLSALHRVYSWDAALLLSAVVSIAGQLGDLSESLIKRYARVKDSGALLPAFGGVLDLLDSFLAAVPAAYVCILALPLRRAPF